MSDTLYIVIPAYNEEAVIEQVIQEWYQVIEQHNGKGTSRLVVIDDGSSDRTYAMIKRMAEDMPLLAPVTKENSGHGPTVLFGYQYAVKRGNADYIFQTDSDGQTAASDFETFWDLRKSYDMVIGQRIGRRDGMRRIFVTRMLKMIVNFIFREKIPDANTPFHLMKADRLKDVLESVPENFYLANVLISIIYIKKNYKVKFVPITFRERQGGTNSLNMIKIFKIGMAAIKDFLYLRNKIEHL